MTDVPSSHVRHVALLSDAQRRDLVADLLRAGAALAEASSPASAAAGASPDSGADPSAGKGPGGDASARPSGPWEVYFDNEEFALTLRGWWLREYDGAWLLKVPTLQLGPDGSTSVGYDELTDPPEILERAGLKPHAEVMRKGHPRPMQSLLAQAKVVPFARMHTTREVYRLDLGAAAAPSLPGAAALRSCGALLEVTLDAARFDIKHAENEAVAESLFQHGNTAPEFLRATVAELRLSGTSGPTGAPGAEQELLAFARGRGICKPACVRGICPKLAAYLQRWRPVHMKALLRAGMIADPAAPAQE